MLKRLAIIVACALAAVLYIYLAGKASSRDLTGQYANSPHSEWFKSRRNSKGQVCCDEGDGHEYLGDYTLNNDGSVTVQLEGKPHVLPPEIVLKGPNPTGHAIWWRFGTSDYCFSPGTLG